MTSNTGPGHDELDEPERWRCGVCLSELPNHLPRISSDMPFARDILSLSIDEESDYIVPKGALSSSIKRGCDACEPLEQYAGYRGGDLKWSHGFLYFSDDEVCQLQLDQESFSTHASNINQFAGKAKCLTGDTQSPEAFKKAANWLKQCRQGHASCNSPSDGTAMPKRILFIEDFESLHVRLIEDADQLIHQPYVCLSHRWMPETRECSLTTERADAFQERIPRESFYPLLRDAIEATHRLGFQYLWIDCLCIYQDSIQDWHIQASEMSSIYENAALTISALSSDHVSGKMQMFSQDRQVKRLQPGTHVGGGVYFTYRHLNSHPFDIDVRNRRLFDANLEDFPLLNRGWAYQERLLSRKRLYFTKYELVWECREALWCECGFQECLWAAMKSVRPTILELDWKDIVSYYSGTELSVDADRLPAISGIARRYGEHRDWTYLAGLWQEDLLSGLLWHVDFESLPRPRPAPPTLPSWSWASAKGLIIFPNSREIIMKAISQSIVLGPNPFGVPISASLVLEGPCVPATLQYQLHSVGGKTAFRFGSAHLVLRLGELMSSSGVSLKTHFLPMFADYSFAEAGDHHIESGAEVLLLVCSLIDSSVRGIVLLSLETSIYTRVGFTAHNTVVNEDRHRHDFEEDLRRAMSVRRITVT